MTDDRRTAKWLPDLKLRNLGLTIEWQHKLSHCWVSLKQFFKQISHNLSQEHWQNIFFNSYGRWYDMSVNSQFNEMRICEKIDYQNIYTVMQCTILRVREKQRSTNLKLTYFVNNNGCVYQKKKELCSESLVCHNVKCYHFNNQH